jgi:alpha-L-rhamnosidase
MHFVTPRLILFGALCALLPSVALAGPDRVGRLRVESLAEPIGLDVPQPRFSWVLEATERGARQAAYQLLIASTAEKARRGDADVWDSGRVASDDNAQVVYGGPPLGPRTRYHYVVKVWDGRGRVSASAPAFFETGLLDRPFQGKFITLGAAEAADRRPFVGGPWIYAPAPPGPAPETGAVRRVAFRGSFTLAPDERVRWAELHMALPGDGKNWDKKRAHFIWVNDREQRWVAASVKDPRWVPITALVRPGENTIALSSPFEAQQAIALAVVLELADGRRRVIHADGGWRTRPLSPDELAKAEWRAEETVRWAPVLDLGPFGDGGPPGPEYRRVDQVVAAIHLRRAFRIDKPVARARLYATAAGIYEARLNGAKVGQDVLTPGWTDYGKRLRYQSYDVTGQLRPGDNALGAIVAPGWFSGRTGVGQNLWGFERALLMELHVDYRDGTTEVIATDERWRASTGPIRRVDLLDGETYDARRELPGWDRPGFPDAGWAAATAVTPAVGRIEGQMEPPPRPVATLPARQVTSPAPGVQVFDLGQNMVGWARVTLRAPAGTVVKLRFAEILNTDGTLFTEALRTANAVDFYVAKGGSAETFEPRFTFHGFRYVEVSGLPAPLPRSAVTGIVVASALEPAGTFVTSNALLNRLQSNIVWGQRGNFLSIPTDCPQRDERLGWSGDINMFARTATFNMDSAAFLAKYLVDLEDGQKPDGRFPDIAPTIDIIGAGNFAWADAGVMIPWLLFEVYGDRRVLERHFGAMQRWIDHRTKGAKDDLNTSWSYGDWVSPPPQTPNAVIGPIYHAHGARLLGRAAAVLGKTEEAERYQALFERIRAAWNRAYVKPDGTIESDTQAAYVLALRYDMLPPEGRAAAVQHLAAAIDRAGGHLATGFLGTGNLLPALSAHGRADLAYDLLLKETNPSWLFSVKNGATTIWERWDGYSPETGPNNKGDMNSYNHYAFGAVGEWMYANVAGLDFDPAAPAWRRLVIRPLVGPAVARGLTGARGEHMTVRGKVASAWKVVGGTLSLEVEVPVHATARVHVPASAVEAVKESGRPAARAPGVQVVGLVDGAAVFEVGAGRYRFTAPSPR